MAKKQFSVKQVASPKEATPIAAERELDEESILEPRKRWSRDITVDRIRPNPKQAREFFDQGKLQELANGIIEHGFAGRLLVRPHPTELDVYELVYGERRWRAARLAGLKMIPCDIGEYTDESMEEIGLLENVQREDLTNYELGKKFASILALQDHVGAPKYSIRSLAQRLGKDKSYIEDRLQYVSAPPDVQQLAVQVPDVSPRIVRELAHVDQPEERAAIIQAVEDGKLGFRDVRDLRKQLKSEEAPTDAKPSRAASVQASAKAARLVALRRLQREDVQIQGILSYWKEAENLNDDVRQRLLTYVESWEALLLEIKQRIQP